MKFLVFGKTGQVARELQRRAPDAVFLGRDSADLTDPAACASAIATANADAVINAAAYTAVDKAEEDEATAQLVNGDAPGAMARACAARKVPFVHISTDYVFDGQGTTPWAPGDPTGPLGAYGRTKLAGEKAVLAAGGRYVILRTSWVVSAHGSNFVKTMLRLSETRGELNVVADQIGGPTPAGDIAETLLVIAEKLAANLGNSDIYHYSGAPDVSWADFAREIFQQAGRDIVVNDIPTSAYPTPAARPPNSRMDCRALLRDYGIGQPDWTEGLNIILKELDVVT